MRTTGCFQSGVTAEEPACSGSGVQAYNGYDDSQAEVIMRSVVAWNESEFS